MIQLSNFSSLFELLAGINLAFIAVNYLNDYSNILAKRVFQIETFVDSNFKDILEKVKELNGKISGLNFQDEKYAHKAGGLTRLAENHIVSLENKSQETTKEALRKCYFKTFSSTCLWSFIFCCLILLISGYESINRTYINDFNIQETVIFFSLFSYIFFLLCWTFSNTKIKFLNNLINKLSWVLPLCVSTFILSLIISICINLDPVYNRYFIYLVLLPILTPCINFIFSVVPTFIKIGAIKRETIKYIKGFSENEVSEFEKDVDAILRAKEWNFDIVNTDNKDFEFEIRGVRHIGAAGLTRMETLIVKEKLELVEEKSNPFDANAIAIMTIDKVRVGYVPKEHTSKFRDKKGKLRSTDCFTSSINYSSEKGYNIKVIVQFKDD